MKQETNINDMEITRQKWVNEGGILYPISGNTVLLKTPGTRPLRRQCPSLPPPSQEEQSLTLSWTVIRIR